MNINKKIIEGIILVGIGIITGEIFLFNLGKKIPAQNVATPIQPAAQIQPSAVISNNDAKLTPLKMGENSTEVGIIRNTSGAKFGPIVMEKIASIPADSFAAIDEYNKTFVNGYNGDDSGSRVIAISGNSPYHYAYVVQESNKKRVVLDEGKNGELYDDIWWSPLSTQLN